MTVTPDYDFADAPEPDLLVIGAQSGGLGLTEWLRKIHKDNKIIMSVCTGAFKVAQAGLLDGRRPDLGSGSRIARSRGIVWPRRGAKNG
jgi:transcriptional regulator GlxA family with amidase domain